MHRALEIGLRLVAVARGYKSQCWPSVGYGSQRSPPRRATSGKSLAHSSAPLSARHSCRRPPAAPSPPFSLPRLPAGEGLSGRAAPASRQPLALGATRAVQQTRENRRSPAPGRPATGPRRTALRSAVPSAALSPRLGLGRAAPGLTSGHILPPPLKPRFPLSSACSVGRGII